MWDKTRHYNERVRELLCSAVSLRRIARLLSIDRKTVARKLVSLSETARAGQAAFLASIQDEGRMVQNLQFDEMESFIHSKCLPVSIPLVVESKTRKVLGFGVCSMPAKGPLATISLRKYGPRADDRSEAAQFLFKTLAPLIAPKATLLTDQKPSYPSWFRPHLPSVNHCAVKGRRGCVVGQGELKKVGFDPIFDLNHTAAMFRANVNRLLRRTWCTSKRMDRLAAHLSIYVHYHNSVLTS